MTSPEEKLWAEAEKVFVEADKMFAQANRVFAQADQVFVKVPEGETILRKVGRILRIFKKTK